MYGSGLAGWAQFCTAQAKMFYSHPIGDSDAIACCKRIAAVTRRPALVAASCALHLSAAASAHLADSHSTESLRQRLARFWKRCRPEFYWYPTLSAVKSGKDGARKSTAKTNICPAKTFRTHIQPARVSSTANGCAALIDSLLYAAAGRTTEPAKEKRR